jgi:microcystin-dependent protein
MKIKIEMELPRWLSRTILIGIPIAIVAIGAWVYAGVPNTFTAGDKLTAQKLNDNFAAVATPPGTVVAFLGPTPPSGWLAADGSMIDSQVVPQYAALVAVLRAAGSVFQGAGLSQAELPDLRGMFLRGVGTNATRMTAAGTAFSGGQIGDYQQDQLQGHYHTYRTSTGAGAMGSPYLMAATGATRQAVDGTDPSKVDLLGPSADGVSGTPRVGSETKPASYSVAYIIKY